MAGKRQASGNTCRRYEWPPTGQVGVRPKVRMADKRAGKVAQISDPGEGLTPKYIRG